MRFCPSCDNILIPRNKRLFCKVCSKEFKLNPKTKDYTIIKTIKHEDKEFSPIVLRKGLKIDTISAQDRKAFEEFFHTS